MKPQVLQLSLHPSTQQRRLCALLYDPETIPEVGELDERRNRPINRALFYLSRYST